ncbi:hypothetical protein E2C01_080363 [Portunus trituberculatus]|uniref:Uncharacterized protein n=1 Tax=Portunus trituberculatus TaxID=210409 RepID=A0A5B7IP41_PORTR|nr:hypothetical protein [Portunus trituberculatus]
MLVVVSRQKESQKKQQQQQANQRERHATCLISRQWMSLDPPCKAEGESPTPQQTPTRRYSHPSPGYTGGIQRRPSRCMVQCLERWPE